MTSTIQLYQGDCLEVMKNIPDKSVDLVLTDPPYNIARDNNFTTMGRAGIDFGEWDKGAAIVSENVAVICDEVSLLKAKILDSTKKWDYLVEKVETRLSQTSFDNSFTMFCEWWWEYNLNNTFLTAINHINTVGILLKALFSDYSGSNSYYDDSDFFTVEFDYYFDGMTLYPVFEVSNERKSYLSEQTVTQFSGYYDSCYWWLCYYFCVPLKSKTSGGVSETVLKALMEMVEKNLHICNSINYKQDANMKHTHSKSFMKYLNQKISDNSDTILSKLGLSSSVSSAQTELDLPSSSSNALTLYNAVAVLS